MGSKTQTFFWISEQLRSEEMREYDWLSFGNQ
jgi:hypothetical protein